MREHNRLAEALQNLNPGWEDDKVFQEARRINVAQYQHVIYKEWLPIVLGDSYMKRRGMLTLSSGYSKDYDFRTDPRTTNEFATAAFRFGHSLIPERFNYRLDRSERGNKTKSVSLKEIFFNPGALAKNNSILPTKLKGISLSGLTKGMMEQEIAAMDASFVEAIRNHLFEQAGDDGGLDLIALNIQRGRDHGIPSYNKYRKLCGMEIATQWSDLSAQMSQDNIDKLKEIYQDINDVDLFIGGISENPEDNGLVGRTFQCIIGYQFLILKKGDRFFYDLDLGSRPKISFSPVQLNEIRKTSMARIICDNSDKMTKIQPFAFKMSNQRSNGIKSCGDLAIPSVNLNVFQENRELFQNCTTVSGANPGASCVFPFHFRNKLYEGCTRDYDDEDKPWCSTKTKEGNKHVTGANEWGHCEDSCLTHQCITRNICHQDAGSSTTADTATTQSSIPIGAGIDSFYAGCENGGGLNCNGKSGLRPCWNTCTCRPANERC
jgi:peroxidase